MTMDSTGGAQEQQGGPLSADSDATAQDGMGSRDDEAVSQRLNGLMRLVGKRTTEAQQQGARAERAEAELAQARERLAAYEEGRTMSDGQADRLALDVQDAADEAVEQAVEQAVEPEPRSEAPFSFWLPEGADEEPDWSDMTNLIDPSAASRASSLPAHPSDPYLRLRTQFDRELDVALQAWGIEGRD